MNEALAHIFSDCASAPGAFGCGVRLPDRTSRVKSFHPDCTTGALEKTLLHLTSAASMLASHDLAGHRMAWQFTGGKLFVTTRADGALFCLITRGGADAGDFFNQMTARFLVSD